MCSVAIVTGASSGIGLEISRTLCRLGYDVYGFGRSFDKSMDEQPHSLEDDNARTAETGCGSFHPIVCDILDTKAMCDHVRQIAAQNEVKVLVNNAGVGYYGLHEELNPQKIQELVRTNLEAPMILTQQLLRELKKHKGWVINISSVTAGQSNPHGCAYGATKAGLLSFSRSLFDEARKYGVRVVSILPDMTQTQLYRNADFKEGEEEQSYLLPSEVAQAVEYIITCRDGLVVSEITLRPQIHRIRRKVNN